MLLLPVCSRVYFYVYLHTHTYVGGCQGSISSIPHNILLCLVLKQDLLLNLELLV